jgi:hypothetical protein
VVPPTPSKIILEGGKNNQNPRKMAQMEKKCQKYLKYDVKMDVKG